MGRSSNRYDTHKCVCKLTSVPVGIIYNLIKIEYVLNNPIFVCSYLFDNTYDYNGNEQK